MSKIIEVEVPENNVIGFDGKLVKNLVMLGSACGLVAYVYIVLNLLTGKKKDAE